MNDSARQVLAETTRALTMASACEQCELEANTIYARKLHQHLLSSARAILYFQGIFGSTNSPNYDVFLGAGTQSTIGELYVGTLSFFGSRPKNVENTSGLNLKINLTPQLPYLTPHYIIGNKIILTFLAQEQRQVIPPVSIEHVLLCSW